MTAERGAGQWAEWVLVHPLLATSAAVRVNHVPCVITLLPWEAGQRYVSAQAHECMHL